MWTNLSALLCASVSLWFNLFLTACASAQPKVTFPEPKLGTVPNLTQVAVPPAYAVALSETHGLLAFVHDRSYKEAHVSLVKLDAKGNPAAYCTSWTLPKQPESLNKVGVYPINVAFHPKLPLLYVWQDVGLNNAAPLTAQPPEWAQLDHLFIYNIAKETPELLVSLCRGEPFHFGMVGGALAVDPAGEFLYVPSVCEGKTRYLHFGRFKLDPDGLPLIDEVDTKLPLPARVKKLSERNVAKGVAVAQLTPIEYQFLMPNTTWGGGHGFAFVGKEAIVSSGYNGLVTWRPADKVATFQGLPVKGQGQQLFTSHPALPFFFVTTANTDSFYRVAHSEGHLSLLPLQITLPETRLFSPPAVFDKGSRVAVGGHYHVYVVPLDAEGNPQSNVTKVQVLSPAVRALVYSPKFDRLYVGVEVSK